MGGTSEENKRMEAAGEPVEEWHDWPVEFADVERMELELRDRIDVHWHQTAADGSAGDSMGWRWSARGHLGCWFFGFVGFPKLLPIYRVR